MRPEYGATATLAAEYLLASGLRVTANEATALVYAIRTETLDFALVPQSMVPSDALLSRANGLRQGSLVEGYSPATPGGSFPA